MIYYNISLQEDFGGERLEGYGTLLGDHEGGVDSILYYNISIQGSLNGERLEGLRYSPRRS